MVGRVVAVLEVPCIFPSSDLGYEWRRHAMNVIPVEAKEEGMGLDIGGIVRVNK
jgi:hypothetical protein